MNGYCILMIVFGILIILFGLYVYTGHDDLLGKGYYKKESKAYLKRLGKIIMITGIVPIISTITSIILTNDIIPVIVLILGIIIALYLSVKFLKE